MYLVTGGDGFVTAFNVANRSVDSRVHVGVSPQSLALTPDEQFLAVADSATGDLAILRASPLSMITTVPVGASPVDVIVPGWKWHKRGS